MGGGDVTRGNYVKRVLEDHARNTQAHARRARTHTFLTIGVSAWVCLIAPGFPQGILVAILLGVCPHRTLFIITIVNSPLVVTTGTPEQIPGLGAHQIPHKA